MKEQITIFAIGDRADYDSFKKFHKEKFYILQSGFDYANTDYRRLLAKKGPTIKTKKVIVFLFFPFWYWNNFIEHNNYKGPYGNRIFYRKFIHFWDKVDKALKDYLGKKEVFFINSPLLCGLYRDKFLVSKKFLKRGISSPRLYNISRVREIENLLNKGHSLFLKPRYGSMGKGITFLDWSNWQTNFIFKNNTIINRRSDRGWKFRDVTGNRKFLSKLIRKDIIIEEGVDSLLLKRMKVDLRLYTFFNNVIYVYPRINRVERIITNISQGAKGDPRILRYLPKQFIERAKKLARRASKILKLKLAGIDIMVDHNLGDIYVIDANLFPGFPKRRTFNLSRSMIHKLKRMRERGVLF